MELEFSVPLHEKKIIMLKLTQTYLAETSLHAPPRKPAMDLNTLPKIMIESSLRRLFCNKAG